MNEISGRTDSILSIRANLIEIVAVAVVVGLGVNLLAAGIVTRFGWSGAMTILFGAVLVLGGCGYLWWRASPRVNKKLVFEGLFVVARRSNEVMSIDRYDFAEKMAEYIRALSAEWHEVNLRPLAGATAVAVPAGV
jgi:hypothetical protein